MSAKKKDKKRMKSSGQGANFAITIVTISAIFVFIGYLIGINVVDALQEQHQQSMQLAREEASAPVVTRQDPQPASPVVPESPTAIPTPPETLYRVQVGVFSERANADRMVSMLKEAGYEGIIIPGPPHRVQTGAFSSQDNAAKLREELIQKGFEAIIVR